jgi:hypothetical protein
LIAAKLYPRHMKAILKFTLCLAACLLVTSRVHALTCYAITQGNHILTFTTSTPGTVSSDVAISGINGAYSVVGIAIRTTTQNSGAANAGVGSLWGIAFNGTNFFLCTITPATGVATQVGGILSLDTSAGADGFGFGFDPAADRFRFISVQTNYEINPNTTSATQQTSFSGFPAQSGAAFTPSSYTGGTSQFYNISRDVTPRTLRTSSNVSTGALSTVGSTTLSTIFAPMGMSFGGSQLYLAAEGDLYKLNTSTGVATLVGAIGGNPTIRGLAIVPASFPPVLSQAVNLTVSGKKRVVTKRPTLLVRGTASCEFGVSGVKVKVGKAGFRNAAGTTSWRFKARLKRGVNVVKVQATGSNGATSSIAVVRIIRR